MALSAIEDRYLSALTEREFPTFTPMEAEMAAPESVDEPAMPPGQRPGDVLVAEVGSRGLPPQAFSGQYPDRMEAFEPTMRQRLADYLQSSFEGLGMDRYKARQNAQSLIGGPSSNAPLSIGLADFVPFLGTGMQVEEGVQMGGEAVQAAKRGDLGEAALLGTGAALSVVPGVAPTVKALKSGVETLGPKAGEMAGDFLQKQGLMPGVVEAGKTMAPSPTAPTDDLGFFSAVEQSAMNVQRKSGTGQAFLNDIAKGENVKADEIKWMGLDDFLKGKKNVTREEVQQFIAENRVEVKEVTLGGTDNTFTDPQKAIEYIAQREGWTPQEVIDNWGYTDQREYITLASDMAQMDPVDGALPAKFGQYTLPGGENYREILLTLPTKGPSTIDAMPDSELRALIMRNDSNADVDGLSRQNLVSMIDGMGLDSSDLSRLSVDNSTQFKSSHWEQPNVLAHIRVNDRVDADGKKMLLIEEVQSDWHQAGRDKGYKNDAALESRFAELTQQHREIVNRRADIVATPGMEQEYSALAKQEQQLIDEMNKLHDTKQYGVPDAPMKDTWYQLALKRALKYAADNGYERVGITTGARQAERYNLSSQVNQIVVTPRMDAATGEKTRSVAVDLKSAGILQLGVNKNGIVDNARGGFDNPAQFKGKPLADIIGKEMAQKIMDSERATFEGAGLNVGGEGMKKYYDEVYPKFLDKYGKKWGAKVGETSVNIGTEDKMVSKLRERGYDPETVTLQEILSDSNGRTPSWLTEDDVLMLELGVELTSKGVQKEPIRYVDITPEMRQSVQKGQPLFTAAPIGAGTAGATMQDKENE